MSFRTMSPSAPKGDIAARPTGRIAQFSQRLTAIRWRHYVALEDQRRQIVSRLSRASKRLPAVYGTRDRIEAFAPRIGIATGCPAESSETTDARDATTPRRHGPLHGGGREAGQHGRRVRPRVRRSVGGVAVANSPPVEEVPDPRLHRGQYLRHVQRREARHRAKHQGPPAWSLAKTPSNTSAWTCTFRLSAPPNR